MDFIKEQFKGFSRFEVFFFSIVLILIVGISFYTNDSKIALISAVCGVTYTILAGKGRILCYFIGIIGTFCYCYLAFKNAFWGNFLLWIFYYLPMEIIGIFKWKKHINKNSGEIYKTALNIKERAAYFILSLVLSIILAAILFKLGGKTPLMDGFTTIFSILGQLLTIKRCIEQWYVWFFVNLISFLMWLFAWQNGEDCLAIVIMWGCYLFLAVYFLKLWQNEIKNNQTH